GAGRRARAQGAKCVAHGVGSRSFQGRRTSGVPIFPSKHMSLRRVGKRPCQPLANPKNERRHGQVGAWYVNCFRAGGGQISNAAPASEQFAGTKTMNGTKSTDGESFGAITTALVGVVNHSTRTVLGRAVSFLAVASLAVASLTPLSAAAAPAGRVPERILVQPKHAAPEAALQAVFTGQGARQAGAIHQINVRILHVPEARLGRVLESLNHNPLIEFAEPDYLFEPAAVPNDTYYSLEWHLPKIAAPAA